ncbi:MAG: cytochrome C oxidase subunit IV family protein [Anaerolineales bacterium]
MATPTKTEPTNTRRDKLSYGAWVMLFLSVLTFGEYLVGVIAPPWGSLLLGVAAFKAFFVIKDYMHVGRLFTEEEDH